MSKEYLTAAAAHDVVVSDRVFHAVCTLRRKIARNNRGRKQFVHRVRCYTPDGMELRGFLNAANKRRPAWEQGISRVQLEAEARVSARMLEGSKKFEFRGLREGENVLVRYVDTAPCNGRETTLFEPVVTLTPYDHALQCWERQMMVTRVRDPYGGEKIGAFTERDMIEYLPILGKCNTNHGDVGIGYVQRPRDDVQNGNFFLKRVWVMDAADRVGQIVTASIERNTPPLILAAYRSKTI